MFPWPLLVPVGRPQLGRTRFLFLVPICSCPSPSLPSPRLRAPLRHSLITLETLPFGGLQDQTKREPSRSLQTGVLGWPGGRPRRQSQLQFRAKLDQCQALTSYPVVWGAYPNHTGAISPSVTFGCGKGRCISIRGRKCSGEGIMSRETRGLASCPELKSDIQIHGLQAP